MPSLKTSESNPKIARAKSNMRASCQIPSPSAVAQVVEKSATLIFADHKADMNGDRNNGYWEQFKGIIERQWGKLIDDELTVVAGERDYLDGKFQARYCVSREGAQKRLPEWQMQHRKIVLYFHAYFAAQGSR